MLCCSLSWRCPSLVFWKRAALLASVALALFPPAGVAVASGPWLAPVDVSESGFFPEVAVNDAGEVVVAWRESVGGVSVVRATLRTAGGGFGAAATLSSPGRDTTGRPKVAMAANGEALVVWQESDGSHIIARSAVRPAGGAFLPAVDLSASGQNATAVDAAIDAVGNAVAAWTRSDGTTSRVQAAARDADHSGFGTAETLSAAGQPFAALGNVAMNGRGDAVVIWSGIGSQMAMRPAGGSWQTPTTVSPPGEISGSPLVGIAEDGSAVAIWTRYVAPDTLMMRGAVKPPGQDFGVPVNLWSDPAVAGGKAVLQVDAAGRAIAAWEQFTGSTAASILVVAERPPGGTFATGTALDPDCWWPDAAIGSDGSAVVACQKWTDDLHSTQAFTRSGPGAFSAPAWVTAPGEEGFEARLAMTSAGDTIAVYQTGSIRAAVHDTTAPAFGAVAVPSTGQAGTPLNFTAAATDTWSTPTVAFDFGDGTRAAGPSATHAYARTGTYTVTVTVTDQAGNTSTETHTIIVADAAPQPPTPTPVSVPPFVPPALAPAPPAAQPLPLPAQGQLTSPSSSPSGASIRAGLRRVLVPSGKAASINRLLRSGYRFTFRAPAAGRLRIDWYYMPKGAKLASTRKRQPKPLRIATGTANPSGSGSVTLAVRLTKAGKRKLQRAKRVKVTTTAAFTPDNQPRVTLTGHTTLRR